MKTVLLAALEGATILALACAASYASAADLTTWQPTTAAGGAPVPPGYWDQQASYQFFGSGAMQPSSVTLAPTNVETIIHDTSTHTANTTTGAQTNYMPITRDSSSMDVSNSTTTNH